MADKERMERLFSAIGIDLERHTTPMPTMPLFQSGIQEPPLLQGITIPALYAATFECLGFFKLSINSLLLTESPSLDFGVASFFAAPNNAF